MEKLKFLVFFISTTLKITTSSLLTSTTVSSSPSLLYNSSSFTPTPLNFQNAMPSSGGQRRLPVISAITVDAFGNTWYIRDSNGQRVPPGPCIFTPRSDRVWVDAAGVHLTVAPQDCGCEGWASTEIWSTTPWGYGTYVFQITGAFVEIDPQVTFGLFTWNDDSPPRCSSEGDCYFHEIDFEISKWGVLSEPQLQFVRQPALVEGNRKRVSINGATSSEGAWGKYGAGECCSFSFDSDGGYNNANIEKLTLVLQWYGGPPRPMIRFFAFDGHYSLNNMNEAGPHLLHSWDFPFPGRVPDEGDARVHFNLWQANWGGKPGFGRINHVLINDASHSSDWIDFPALGIPLEGQFRRRRRSSKFKSNYAGARYGAESSFGSNKTVEEDEEEDDEKQEEDDFEL